MNIKKTKTILSEDITKKSEEVPCARYSSRSNGTYVSAATVQVSSIECPFLFFEGESIQKRIFLNSINGRMFIYTLSINTVLMIMNTLNGFIFRC